MSDDNIIDFPRPMVGAWDDEPSDPMSDIRALIEDQRNPEKHRCAGCSVETAEYLLIRIEGQIGPWCVPCAADKTKCTQCGELSMGRAEIGGQGGYWCQPCAPARVADTGCTPQPWDDAPSAE